MDKKKTLLRKNITKVSESLKKVHKQFTHLYSAANPVCWLLCQTHGLQAAKSVSSASNRSVAVVAPRGGKVCRLLRARQKNLLRSQNVNNDCERMTGPAMTGVLDRSSPFPSSAGRHRLFLGVCIGGPFHCNAFYLQFIWKY